MTDPVSVAGLALTLATKTTEALTALRERAQRTKDLDIKDQISTLYDNVLQLKEVISRLVDENTELKRQLEQQQHPPERPQLRQVGDTNYYFLGEKGPFCQPCYDTKEKLIALSPSEPWNNGIRRECPSLRRVLLRKENGFLSATQYQTIHTVTELKPFNGITMGCRL